ncbi:AI-2E family transporter [Angustibacter sp. Root456]|uniref:AI-2E family transporter n=1 Tax=Angustibacter sp. Root456 TaxID=1736539 RepID=UPI0009E6FE49|nr:AI-2E family transporter [Angustibacter sp. Root456]
MDDSTTEPSGVREDDPEQDDATEQRVEDRRERQQEAAAEAAASLGRPGRPLNRQSPFFVGFVGAIGVLFAWGLLHVVTQLSSVLLLIVVALFLALGLDPVVQWLQARGLRRGYAAAVVFLGVILVFVGIIALVVPPVVNEAGQLLDQAPDFVDNLLKNHTLRDLDKQYGLITRVQEELRKRATDQSLWTSVFGGVLGAGKAVVGGLFSAFTVLVLTLYFTASLPTVKASVYRMVPRSRRQRVSFLSEEISRRVGGYFLGQIAVATLNGIFSYIMMTIVGIPYAAVLAVSVGVLGLIPMVGATLGAVLVLIVALFQSGTAALIVAVYYVIYQQVENYVLSPRIMQRTVAVPGAVTVVAALAGGTLLGIVGALMAIPVAAGLLLLYQEVLLPRQQQT